ncbi:hypothetical protein HYZ99_01920 [Candidatus Peregrinibacteria bacterium]|nr:hypothetical protein [Candidatus Peregrinibacteria bacterium]
MKPQEATPWDEIVENISGKLGITPELLEENRDAIQTRLMHATCDMQRACGDIFAVNQYLRLAADTARLGGRDPATRKIFQQVHEAHPLFKDSDPATIITIAMLCKLLRCMPDEVAEPIQRRFALMNWMLSKECVTQLGIQ